MQKKPSMFRPLPPLPRAGRIRKPAVLIFGFIFIFFLFCGLGVGILLNWYSQLPSLKQLENLKPNLVTRIFSADHVLLKEYFIERRFFVPIQKTPGHLIKAVIAAEDRKFYYHWGMDIRRTTAALLKDIAVREFAQGASTITQQLARNLFLTPEKSIVRKIKELVAAVKIERKFTKSEILEMYLNQIYLGGGVYGIQAASQKFFNKNASELSLSESALIAATIKTPEAYRPDKAGNFVRSKRRRNWVLRSIGEMGWISQKACARALREPIAVDSLREKKISLAPYFTEFIRKYLEKKYGSRMLYTGGLRVYTTLQYKSQKISLDSLHAKIAEIQRPINIQYVSHYKLYKKIDVPYDTLVSIIDSVVVAQPDLIGNLGIVPDTARDLRIVQAALVSINSKTGAILAMIGGRSFRESEFNRATQALRQPGSAFKPFIFTTAIDSGYTPISRILDQPISLKTPVGIWRPENYNKKFSGPVTLRKALEKSINIAAIQLINKVSPRAVIRHARRMGIYHPLRSVPALAIGSCEVTPLEITSAYSAFANNGIRAIPYYIERILDKDGNILEEHTPRDQESLNPQTAYTMADMLKGVILRGTGYGARFPGGFLRPAGGKTGTTNDYTDAWFVGFTPHITCGVWLGIDSKLTLGNRQTGSRAALPIWTAYMKAAHDGLPEMDFHKPSGIVTCRVCTESSLLARNTCPNTVEEIFKEGTQPADSCNLSHFKKSKSQKKIFLLF